VGCLRVNGDRLTVAKLPASECLLSRELGIDPSVHFNALALDLREAVEAYVTDSEEIAMVLRGDTAYLDEDVIDDTWKQVRRMEDSMTSLDREIVVWRGCPMDAARQTIADSEASYLSTSVDQQVAWDFANRCEDPTLLRITVEAGHPLLLVPPYLHHERDEGEVLLDRSTALRETFETCPDGEYDEVMGIPVISVRTAGFTPYVELPESAFD
jgi:hypothetical protein